VCRSPHCGLTEDRRDEAPTSITEGECEERTQNIGCEQSAKQVTAGHTFRLAPFRLENSSGLNMYSFGAGRSNLVERQLAFKRANNPVSENSHIN
jgi:hypothetical protein